MGYTKAQREANAKKNTETVNQNIEKEKILNSEQSTSQNDIVSILEKKKKEVS
jgi:hypothetical protein